ncbi:MAG: DUF3786 domain-containing protein [Candidatus Methanospirareceae archaeon]
MVVKVKREDLIAFGQIRGGELMELKFADEMTARTEELWKIRREQAEELAKLVGGETVDLKLDSATEWGVVVRPLPYLHIYFFLQLYEPEFPNEVRVLFDKRVNESDIDIADVYDITRLMSNALVRAAGRITGSGATRK